MNVPRPSLLKPTTARRSNFHGKIYTFCSFTYRAECTNFLKEIGDVTKIMACLDADHEQMMKVEACAKKKLNGELGWVIHRKLEILIISFLFQMHQLCYPSQPYHPTHPSHWNSVFGRIRSCSSWRAGECSSRATTPIETIPYVHWWVHPWRYGSYSRKKEEKSSSLRF